ncbi:hypothetical protein [Ensifer adhaerens]|jgi:hypothetical protein|uniref:hypothetical protein n=1 Tax=Ensifer adhaerens TaxID=106592 RepID=UPI0015D60051|nr:hypothetical protein [Ensifer adhaerens]
MAEARDEIRVGNERLAKCRKVDQTIADELFRHCQIKTARQKQGSRIGRPEFREKTCGHW